MSIIDIAKYRSKGEAIGTVQLDLTDPVTGKVKERVGGKNHVFMDSLFSAGNQSQYGSVREYPWYAKEYGISAALMCMNDDGTAVDPDFQYLRGQTIGYGKPSAGTLGLFRGAYSVPNQVLAEHSLTKVRWKFQYEFTPQQANGTIRNIGLTKQYNQSEMMHPSGLGALSAKPLPSSMPTNSMVSDGRYAYTITGLGLVTKWDMWFGMEVVATYDLSADMGAIATEYKQVGFDPTTGKFYVYKYHSTAANRKMYVYSDNTFGALEATHVCSNCLQPTTSYMPFYVYDGSAYFLSPNSYAAYKLTFATNVYTVVTLPTAANNCMVTEAQWSTVTNTRIGAGTIGTPAGIYIAGYNGNGSIYDAINNSLKTQWKGLLAIYPTFFHPLGGNDLFSSYDDSDSEYRIFSNSALTTYVLPEPVTKTSAYGLTATYELEVFW